MPTPPVNTTFPSSLSLLCDLPWWHSSILVTLWICVDASWFVCPVSKHKGFSINVQMWFKVRLHVHHVHFLWPFTLRNETYFNLFVPSVACKDERSWLDAVKKLHLFLCAHPPLPDRALINHERLPGWIQSPGNTCCLHNIRFIWLFVYSRRLGSGIVVVVWHYRFFHYLGCKETQL